MPGTLINGLKRLQPALTRAGVDGAVGYAAGGRALGAAMGVINLFLVLRSLRPEEQGFYYTFASMLGMMALFELGLGGLLVHFASHELVGLRWEARDTIAGADLNLARIRSMARQATLLYIGLAVLGLLVVFAAGQSLFGTAATGALAWRGPWSLLCVSGAATFAMTPLLSIAEGLGLVAEIARMRFVQVLVSNLTLWVMLASGTGLWAPAGSALAVLAVQMIWAGAARAQFFRDLLTDPGPGAGISWRRELLPVQWRAGLASISAYMANQAANPILLRLGGPVAAGRFGLTMSMSLTCLGVGAAWSNTKWASFGALVSAGKFQGLDREFNRALRHSLAALGMLGAGMVVFAWLFGVAAPAYAHRMLSPALTAVMYVQVLGMHIVTNLAAYCRAYKQESLFGLRVVQGAASVAFTVFFGAAFGIEGVVWSNSVLMAGLIVPAAWAIRRTNRRAWQASRSSGIPAEG